ncbi:MAG TPA: hypothetical protein VGI90_05810 [Steroidobacteraceae bacterium]|jgi:hypothetical protein
MTVIASAQGIALEGSCPSEDAEVLLQHLASTPAATIDLGRCESAHTAVIQVLMAFKPKLLKVPRDNSMWRWVHPVLKSED